MIEGKPDQREYDRRVGGDRSEQMRVARDGYGGRVRAATTIQLATREMAIVVMYSGRKG
jgi:hypothetical protein